ncbi:TolC family outer membrane protein [Sphingomonas sp. NBWT7]|uniref:TolC family outer membrane protein n=1 Tax=Sphingomonas sp. NBWT7 TaxID=2596913 RepID=UPI0016263F09|nr:TolC family outer membrane protein [Sphingomonas sp. NBWT7]QNE30589.1 TolC family outer membrane protein [Sphingomonas sp. NBWT7]
MKRAVPLAALLSLAATPAAADTLREALARAYKDNPTLTGSRAQQRATDETVPIARAAGIPTLGTNAGYNENFLQTGNSLTNPARQLTAFAGVTVPVYQGGAVKNSVRAAETRVEAGQAGLRSTEATTFTDVVAAYNNVLRDEAIVGLNTQNVRVLGTNLRASRDRFQVGDLTRTDVAQSEARLSLARAQLQTAQANLVSSRENYVRLVGQAPGVLEPPPPLPNLPNSPDAAVDVAMQNNPALLAAQKTRDATAYDVRVAQAGRLPQVGVTVGEQYNNFLGSLGAGQGFTTIQSGAATTVGLQLQLPIFQGGRVSAQIRQARALRGQAIENATATERQVIASARSAYAIWRSSLEVIASSETAVNANKLSLEGVRAENSVGNRTILDILNAEQELLNSQVTLVTARRDAYVAGFALLAAMGEAEARDLGLDGGPLYDPTVNYRNVRRSISDFRDGPQPQAEAPGTRNIPAQNATVTRPLDPALKSDVDRSPALTTGENAPNR